MKCNVVPTDHIESTRNSIANTLQRFLCKTKHINYLDKYILNAFTVSKKYLCENSDIMITKADKCQTTVIMEKKDYYEKINLLLNDSTIYKKLRKRSFKSAN